MQTDIAHPLGGFFRDRMLNSVALSHFIVDLLNGQRAILLAYLSVLLGMSNYGLGIMSSAYVISGALAQPFFGYIADKYGARWVVAGGVFWMGTFFSLALFFPGWQALGFLILASISSGAFHPAGAMEATLAGRDRFNGREATASSLFFLFGQMGGGIGPLLGGSLLHLWGMPGLLLLSVFVYPISGFASFHYRNSIKPLRIKEEGANRKLVISRALMVLVVVSAFQAWAQSNIIVFMPRFLLLKNLDASVYGLIIGLFTVGSAIGVVIGGELADKFSRKIVITRSLIIAAIPLALIAFVGYSFWLYPLMFIAGIFTGGPYSVIVVQAQKVIPGGMGLASGLAMGFIFSSGALGTAFMGKLADSVGFQPIFYLTAVIALVGGLAGFFMRQDTLTNT